MRGPILGSGLVHLALVIVLLVVRPPTRFVVPGPEVVQVSLMDPSSMIQPAVAVPPAPEKAPEPATVAPTEDVGVKLEPRPKKPKKAEKQEEQAPPAPTPALPYTAVGASGLKGAISLDSNFEFTYYLALVRNRIAQAWAPPAGLTTGGAPVEAVLYFRISRDGGIAALRIETASGYEFFDRSALRAVQLSDPLPPLPLGYAGGDLGVHFGFQFVAP